MVLCPSLSLSQGQWLLCFTLHPSHFLILPLTQSSFIFNSVSSVPSFDTFPLVFLSHLPSTQISYLLFSPFTSDISSRGHRCLTRFPPIFLAVSNITLFIFKELSMCLIKNHTKKVCVDWWIFYTFLTLALNGHK
jgi:hypothetical protein